MTSWPFPCFSSCDASFKSQSEGSCGTRSLMFRGTCNKRVEDHSRVNLIFPEHLLWAGDSHTPISSGPHAAVTAAGDQTPRPRPHSCVHRTRVLVCHDPPPGSLEAGGRRCHRQAVRVLCRPRCRAGLSGPSPGTPSVSGSDARVRKPRPREAERPWRQQKQAPPRALTAGRLPPRRPERSLTLR